jgi:membrane-bound lytic murein transglycosylase D
MTGRARIPLIAICFAWACAPSVRPKTAPDPSPDSVSAAIPAAMEELDRKVEAAKPVKPGATKTVKAAATKPVKTAATKPEKPVATKPEKPVASKPEAPAATNPERPAAQLPSALELTGVVSASTEATDAPPLAFSFAPSWDIEVKEYLSHDRVEFYVRRFTGPARPTIVSWMQRGLRYEPMIRKTFRNAGIPEDMYYLGLVESGYDPHAYSRAAAVGMWQFMTATARGVGLRVDWWVDERRDPIKSTKAAARFLSSLRDQFGSLYLAAAAYNGGPARVSRGLTRYADDVGDSEGDDQFFALAETRALRSETLNYVPQLIAAAAIGKEPWKYGIRLDPVAPYAYDSVLVPPGTAVASLTLATGAPLDSLRHHNPHLLRGATPPFGETWVRVPLGYAPESFANDFFAIPDSVRNAWTPVKVKKATAVATLAKAHGITATQLRWYNPKLKGNTISAGTTINVPTKLAISGAFAVGDPSLERYGAAVNGVHIVRRGETLSHIAARNGTSVARLMSLNGLKKNVIYPGQAIRVRAAAARKRS